MPLNVGIEQNKGFLKISFFVYVTRPNWSKAPLNVELPLKIEMQLHT